MISKRLLKVLLLAAIAIVCASALAWRSQTAAGQVDKPATAAPAGQGEEAAPTGVVPGGPGFYAQRAHAFQPYLQTDQWAYSAAALYNPGPGKSYYHASLSLPQGATVTQFVAYYYDNDSDPYHYLDVDLYQCPFALIYCNTMATVSSPGADPDNRYAVDDTISYAVIDNQANSYIAELGLPPSDQVMLIGIRVDYGYGAVLPLVMKGR